VPHWPQKGWPGGFTVAHEGHVFTTTLPGASSVGDASGVATLIVAPHDEQNLLVVGTLA